MIPSLSYPGILTPLNLDPRPLVDQESVLSNFDLSNDEHQVQHLPSTVLKKSIVDQFLMRGLIIKKVDVWRWNLDYEKHAVPHTDGNYDTGGRTVGVNWPLVDYTSGVEFYDTDIGETIFEEVPDGRTHTLWNFPSGTEPLVTWRSRYPSLINPQTPHRVTGTGFRYSVTLKFEGKLSYDTVLKKLWDLRIDYDYWAVNIEQTTLDKILELVNRLELTATMPEGKIVAYNLDRDLELIKLISTFCKKPVKSLRVFKYEEGAVPALHIDYDNTLKQFPAYALNIPLSGSNECEIDFYKNTGGLKEFWHNTAGSYMMPSDDNLVFKSSTLAINSPHLLRINIPHQVRINKGASRKVLSIRFIDTELDNPTDIILPKLLTSLG
jgi:hypothetical protein